MDSTLPKREWMFCKESKENVSAIGFFTRMKRNGKSKEERKEKLLSKT